MSGLGWSQMDIKAQENITFINEIICGLLTCLWFVFGLEQMHWKRSESVCLCNNAMLRSLWKTGEDMRIRRIIIIMKGEKSKNSSVQGKKKIMCCAGTQSSIFCLCICLWWMVGFKVLHKFGWQSPRHNKNSWILLIFTLEWLLQFFPHGCILFMSTLAEARGSCEDEQRIHFSAHVVLIHSQHDLCVQWTMYKNIFRKFCSY